MAKAVKSSKKNLHDKFQALGLVSDMDFVLHLPMRYEDETRLQKIAELRPGEIGQCEGTVHNVQINYHRKQQLTATLRDETASLSLRWIHFYGSQRSMLENAGLVRARGEVRGSAQWGLEMVHPKISRAGGALPSSLTPVYSATEGLTQMSLRNHINAALSRVEISDSIPPTLQKRYALANFSQALRYLHNPPQDADTQALMEKSHWAWNRVKFDELLAQQIALSLAREQRVSMIAPAIAIHDNSLYQKVLASFQWNLTTAQQRVLHEILQDLSRPFPMHRLLQGDVGSGKTIVAALAGTAVLSGGYQVAIMTPTEILAEQHFLKMSEWFAPHGIDVTWLSGSLRAKEKHMAQERIRNGEAQLVIGTQALIQKDVEFARLGLMIVDEQHRFGVGQRLTLGKKGQSHSGTIELVPHQLSMSATPIPRTLAMSYLADLEVSVIDELPPGRQPVTTKLMVDERRDELLQYIRHECLLGRQAYWVCPLVEESEHLQLQTAIDTHAKISLELNDLRVGLIHGRMSAAEKAEVMQAFKANQLNLLVATTVIEVGVDVPNASLMVIEHTERFGLAQLHQLRGRVGRGAQASYCILLFQNPLSLQAKLRLKSMYESTDGFEIARRDLEQRGPGEFLGLRQSGEPMLRFADIQLDSALVEQAREAAGIMLTEYTTAAHAHVKRWAQGRTDYLRF